MTDHNTLDDLVRVARNAVMRCEGRDCGVVATHWVCEGTSASGACDQHAEEERNGGSAMVAELCGAGVIRRLIASGLLK